VKAAGLPALPSKPGLEPRGAIWAKIQARGEEINVINTHLGLDHKERNFHVETLLGPDWLGDPRMSGPLVLCGDFNAGRRSHGYRAINAVLRDAQLASEASFPKNTWPSRLPISSIDHVFVNRAVNVESVLVPHNCLTKAASDHLPVICDIKIESRGRDTSCSALTHPSARAGTRLASGEVCGD
jgi:endonuclease/exonuclease/phosphatase family metal-dependent hydrolase